MGLPVQFGRYEVRERIGQGQMGTVYLATDPLIDRPVAVKVLRDRPGLDSEEAREWRARFEREVCVTGKLSHPNVVSVLDVGLSGDTPFIVMEYVDGSNVEDLLQRDPGLSTGRVLEICADVAAALDCAHSHGVVHRDVKPGNILLSSSGTAKVADFGVAHVADARMTRTGMTYGTPAFMSPEQATAVEIGPGSDQFSLASVAYFMLVGEVPFSGSSTSAVLYRLVNEDPVPPQSINPSVSKELGTALLRALAKNPADRYANCSAMVAALRSADETVASNPHAVASPAVPGTGVDSATTVIAASPRASAPRNGPESPNPPGDHRFGLSGSRPATLLAVPALLAVLLFAWAYRGPSTDSNTRPADEPVRAGTAATGAPQQPEAGPDSTSGREQPEIPPTLPNKLAERARNARNVLDEVLGVAEGIPQRLLSESRCVAVIPGVIKVGFGFGGRHGKGLVSCRTANGWSTPSFVAITGGSFGFQLGAQSTDLVLMFVSGDAAEHLADNEITLGGDASVSAGPVGRTAEADTNIELESEIYSYSRSKGLFAGVSLEGATLRPDKDANRDAYGRGASQAELLRSQRAPVASELTGLVRRLEAADG